MRAFVPLLLSVAVAGCATVGGEKVDQLKSGTTIAPVSVMGDTLALRQTGTTVFQNQKRDMDVAAWGIDRHAESIAGKVVGGTGKFRVAQADTEKVRRTVKLQDDFWTGSAKVKGGAGPIATFVEESKADYLLLIAPAAMGDPFMGTNQNISGYGIYQRSFVGLRRAMNFITVRTILLEGKTGEEVARTQCAVSAPREDWLDAKTATQPSDGTRNGIEKLFEDGLRKCLASLNLG